MGGAQGDMKVPDRGRGRRLWCGSPIVVGDDGWNAPSHHRRPGGVWPCGIYGAVTTETWFSRPSPLGPDLRREDGGGGSRPRIGVRGDVPSPGRRGEAPLTGGCRGKTKPGALVRPPVWLLCKVPTLGPRSESGTTGVGPRLVVAGPSCAVGRIRLRRLLPRSLRG